MERIILYKLWAFSEHLVWWIYLNSKIHSNAWDIYIYRERDVFPQQQQYDLCFECAMFVNQIMRYSAHKWVVLLFHLLVKMWFLFFCFHLSHLQFLYFKFKSPWNPYKLHNAWNNFGDTGFSYKSTAIAIPFVLCVLLTLILTSYCCFRFVAWLGITWNEARVTTYIATSLFPNILTPVLVLVCVCVYQGGSDSGKRPCSCG